MPFNPKIPLIAPTAFQRFFGRNGVYVQPAETYDPARGRQVILRTKCTPTQWPFLRNFYLKARTAFQAERGQDGYFECRAYYPYDPTTENPNTGILTDLWELDSEDLELSLWNFPPVQAEFKKITKTDNTTAINRATLMLMVNKFVAGDFTYTDQNGASQNITIQGIQSMCGSLGINYNVIAGIMNSMLNGVTSFYFFAYVVRHNIVVPFGSNIGPVYTNVAQVLTSPQMYALEKFPAPPVAPFQLPDQVWLKKSPTVRQIAADRWAISQEYRGADSFDTNIYLPAS